MWKLKQRKVRNLPKVTELTSSRLGIESRTLNHFAPIVEKLRVDKYRMINFASQFPKDIQGGGPG